MQGYTNAEMTDMVLMYDRAFGNSPGARRLYDEPFPGRNLSDNAIGVAQEPNTKCGS